MILINQTDNAAIGDTIAAVFRRPEYQRSESQTIWAILLRGIVRLFQGIVRLAMQHSGIGIAIRVLIFTAVALVLARIAYGIYLRSVRGHMPRQSSGVPRPRDPWLTAQELAVQGRYTDAAHALYVALLYAVAQRGQLALHPSKTIGDYVRELRQIPDQRFTAPFTDFARSYEVIVYDLGVCNADRYEQLRHLAAPILGAHA